MRKIQITLLGITLFLTGQAYAGGYLGSQEITVLSTAYNEVIVNMANPGNPDGCSQPNAILLSTHIRYDEIYAIILTAYTTGKKINIFVSGCNSLGFKQISLYLEFLELIKVV